MIEPRWLSRAAGPVRPSLHSVNGQTSLRGALGWAHSHPVKWHLKPDPRTLGLCVGPSMAPSCGHIWPTSPSWASVSHVPMTGTVLWTAEPGRCQDRCEQQRAPRGPRDRPWRARSLQAEPSPSLQRRLPEPRGGVRGSCTCAGPWASEEGEEAPACVCAHRLEGLHTRLPPGLPEPRLAALSTILLRS